MCKVFDGQFYILFEWAVSCDAVNWTERLIALRELETARQTCREGYVHWFIGAESILWYFQGDTVTRGSNGDWLLLSHHYKLFRLSNETYVGIVLIEVVMAGAS